MAAPPPTPQELFRLLSPTPGQEDPDEVHAFYQRLAALGPEELAAFAEATNAYGWTTLRLASIFSEASPIVRLLIEKGGADPEQTNDENETLLMYALSSVEATRFLVEEQRVNVTAIGEINRTVLHYGINSALIGESQADALKIILKNGAAATINAQDVEKITPLMLAFQLGRFNLVPILLQYEPDIYLKDSCVPFL